MFASLPTKVLLHKYLSPQLWALRFDFSFVPSSTMNVLRKIPYTLCIPFYETMTETCTVNNEIPAILHTYSTVDGDDVVNQYLKKCYCHLYTIDISKWGRFVLMYYLCKYILWISNGIGHTWATKKQQSTAYFNILAHEKWVVNYKVISSMYHNPL